MNATGGINVSGTQALGDYLLGQITNTQALLSGSLPASTTLAAPTGPPPPTAYAGYNAFQNAYAGSQYTATSTLLSTVGGAPVPSGQVPLTPLVDPLLSSSQQVLQSTYAATQFDSVGTLLGSLGLGTNTNTLV